MNKLGAITAEQLPAGKTGQGLWHTHNTANVNLLSFSHNSPVTDAQTDCLLGK